MLTLISVQIDWELQFLKHINCCNLNMNAEFKMTCLMVGELYLLCCLLSWCYLTSHCGIASTPSQPQSLVIC